MTATIREIAYPRFGLVGNPSDGYGGKVIAVTFTNFAAEVSLSPSEKVGIVNESGDECHFASLEELARRCDRDGHPPRHRLMTAAVRRFMRHCERQRMALSSGFDLCYRTTIPREVGLAGSSALVVAAQRALGELFHVPGDTDTRIDMALKTETEELGMVAGLMDRTIQVLGGILFFDCAAPSITASARRIEPAALPHLYLAYNEALARDSGTIHRDVRARYEAGDPEVRSAMAELRNLAQEAFEQLLAGRGAELSPIINRNYDIRASIFTIHPGDEEMVRTARRVGASAKFAGSGGSVVGTYEDEAMLHKLREAFEKIGATLIVPHIE